MLRPLVAGAFPATGRSLAAGNAPAGLTAWQRYDVTGLLQVTWQQEEGTCCQSAHFAVANAQYPPPAQTLNLPKFKRTMSEKAQFINFSILPWFTKPA